MWLGMKKFGFRWWGLMELILAVVMFIVAAVGDIVDLDDVIRFILLGGGLAFLLSWFAWVSVLGKEFGSPVFRRFRIVNMSDKPINDAKTKKIDPNQVPGDNDPEIPHIPPGGIGDESPEDGYYYEKVKGLRTTMNVGGQDVAFEQTIKPENYDADRGVMQELLVFDGVHPDTYRILAFFYHMYDTDEEIPRHTPNEFILPD